MAIRLGLLLALTLPARFLAVENSFGQTCSPHLPASCFDDIPGINQPGRRQAIGDFLAQMSEEMDRPAGRHGPKGSVSHTLIASGKTLGIIQELSRTSGCLRVVVLDLGCFKLVFTYSNGLITINNYFSPKAQYPKSITNGVIQQHLNDESEHQLNVQISMGLGAIDFATDIIPFVSAYKIVLRNLEDLEGERGGSALFTDLVLDGVPVLMALKRVRQINRLRNVSYALTGTAAALKVEQMRREYKDGGKVPWARMLEMVALGLVVREVRLAGGLDNVDTIAREIETLNSNPTAVRDALDVLKREQHAAIDDYFSTAEKVKQFVAEVATPSVTASPEMLRYGNPLGTGQQWRTLASGWRAFDAEQTRTYYQAYRYGIASAIDEARIAQLEGKDTFDAFIRNLEVGNRIATRQALGSVEPLLKYGSRREASELGESARLGDTFLRGERNLGDELFREVPCAIKARPDALTGGGPREVFGSSRIMVDPLKNGQPKPAIRIEAAWWDDDLVPVAHRWTVQYVADADLMRDMWTRQRQLYRIVTDPAVPKDEAAKAIIEMGDLLRKTLPYKQGTSGIADALVHALMEFRGIPLGAIRPGIGFDLKSFTRSTDDFIDEFPNYFE